MLDTDELAAARSEEQRQSVSVTDEEKADAAAIPAKSCAMCNTVIEGQITETLDIDATTTAYFCGLAHKLQYLKQITQPDDPVAGSHYRRNGIEAYNVIDAFELDFYSANALTYILRAPYKGNKLTDIQKAIRTLERLVLNLQKKK